MRYRRGTLPILVVLVALAVGAAPAAATTYCVNTTGTECDPAPFSDFAVALTAADGNAGHDTVRLGPGSYTNGGFAGDDVDVVGAGSGTVLSAPAGNAVAVLSLTGPSSVSSLTLSVPAGNNNRGLVIERGKVQDVTVDAGAGSTSAIGIRTTDSGTVDLGHVSVTAAAGTGSTALKAEVGDLIVRDSSLTATTGIAPSATESLKVSGAFINASVVGILGAGGFMNIENALIAVTSTGARGIVVPGSLPSIGLANGTMEGRNLTIIGNGSPNSIGVDVAGTAAIVGTNADATISSSVIRGTTVAIRRTGDDPAPGQTGGNAKLTVKYSLLGAVLDQSGPPGGADETVGNIPGNPDPLFNAPLAADFTPKPGSPLIDRADPRDLLPGESTVDIVGRPRTSNGRRDIGAFEYQAVPAADPPDKIGPKVRIVTTSARLTRGGRLRIRLSCPRDEVRGCKGGLTANSAKRLKLTKRSKSKILRLGKSNFNTIAAGKSKVVSIKVSKTARGVIAKRRKLSVKLTAAARDRAKNLGKTTRTITVRPAR